MFGWAGGRQAKRGVRALHAAPPVRVLGLGYNVLYVGFTRGRGTDGPTGRNGAFIWEQGLTPVALWWPKERALQLRNAWRFGGSISPQERLDGTMISDGQDASNGTPAGG